MQVASPQHCNTVTTSLFSSPSMPQRVTASFLLWQIPQFLKVSLTVLPLPTMYALVCLFQPPQKSNKHLEKKQ